MKHLQLSKNLKLISVQENNYRDGKLLAVVCYFTFFDEEGAAYVSTDKLESKYASYGITEMCSELSDSFTDLLDENWDKVAKHIKKFVKEWDKQQKEYAE